MNKKVTPTIRISVAKRNQWFLTPPKSVKREVIEKKILESGFGVYSCDGKDDKKFMKDIHKITKLILSKK